MTHHPIIANFKVHNVHTVSWSPNKEALNTGAKRSMLHVLTSRQWRKHSNCKGWQLFSCFQMSNGFSYMQIYIDIAR